eukprot:Skav225852  [mRNA]  locus=scaffold345:228473:229997:+ [translate_table: standard]
MFGFVAAALKGPGEMMSRKCSSASAMDSRPGCRMFMLSALSYLLMARFTFVEPGQILHGASRTFRSQAKSLESSVGLSEPKQAISRQRGRLGASPEDKGFSELKKQLNVKAVGRGRGSFILEMGGVKILVNPNLEGSESVKPETVHEDFDYVFLTSEEPEFFHRETVNKMKLSKVKFVASAKAGQELTKMMVRNLAVLQNGPGGQCYLQSNDKSGAAIGILSAPGAGGMPWERQEQAFVFVNLENGAAVAYEAFGQYLGKGAGSNKPGIPEEAYQVDYLITPDLREAAGVAAGLAEKGAKLKAVLRLPGEGPLEDVTPLAALDLFGFGIEDNAEDFQTFLKDDRSDSSLSETNLVMLKADETVDLSSSA